MKKLLTLIACLMIVFSLSSADLTAKPAIMKKHKGKTGKDDKKISCSYCHKKAKIPKKKGGKAAQKGNIYCVKCHKN